MDKRKNGRKNGRKTMTDPLHRTEYYIPAGEAQDVNLTAAETAQVEQARQQAADDEARRKAESLPTRVNQECHRRCTEVANESGQLNLASKRAAGLLPMEEHATHDALIQWVNDMQAAARGLISAGDETYAQDNHWPVASPGIADLAKKY